MCIDYIRHQKYFTGPRLLEMHVQRILTVIDFPFGQQNDSKNGGNITSGFWEWNSFRFAKHVVTVVLNIIMIPSRPASVLL